MRPHPKIWEFFNISDLTHLRAYQILNSTGFWPEWFVRTFPEDIVFPLGWQLILMDKMTTEFVKERLK